MGRLPRRSLPSSAGAVGKLHPRGAAGTQGSRRVFVRAGAGNFLRAADGSGFEQQRRPHRGHPALPAKSVGIHHACPGNGQDLPRGGASLRWGEVRLTRSHGHSSRQEGSSGTARFPILGSSNHPLPQRSRFCGGCLRGETRFGGRGVQRAA